MKEAIDSIISPLLTKYIHMGVVVGILDGKQTAVFGYGQVSEARPMLPDGNTFFEIGSITKVFTALLLANMVEEGLVSLDTPVQELLPAFPNLPKEITLLRLATHTSGLPRLPSNFNSSAARNPRNPYAAYSLASLHAYLSSYKSSPSSTYPPSYLYSNLGFGILGYALGQKLGMSYEQAILSRICHPLGLSETEFTLTAEQSARLATPHTAEGKPTLNWDSPALGGAGALRSTSQDMLRFLAANLGQFPTSLQSAWDLCHQIQIENPNPYLAGIALGWHVRWLNPERSQTYWWHNGGTGGYHSFTGFVKRNQSGVIILSNYGLGSDSEIDNIGVAVLKWLSNAH